MKNNFYENKEILIPFRNITIILKKRMAVHFQSDSSVMLSSTYYFDQQRMFNKFLKDYKKWLNSSDFNNPN